MKLFDYKFLILLALTLVVYFMFREIIDLRNKVDNLENKVKTIDGPSYNAPKQIEQKKPVFQIPLPVKKQEVQKVQEPVIESKIVLEPQGQQLSIIQENDATESESFANSAVEKLEIYSNDNLDNDDEDFSIGDSSEIDIDNLGDSSEIDLNAIEKELKSETETESENSIVEDQNTREVAENTEEKKKNLLVEFEGDNILENIVTNSEKDIDMILSSNTSDVKSVQSGELSYKSLMKMKLAQLQCLAEEKDISLVNEEKGKKKTKSELSNELLVALGV